MTLFFTFIFLFLIFAGIPLYLGILGLSIYLFWAFDIPLLSTVVNFQKLQHQDFIAAIPLFTFSGYLLSKSKAPERILNLFTNCFAFLRGSTSAIVITIMALFTSLTGASGITILALGGIMYPLLFKRSKNNPFAYGLITSSGSIGLLFAPSLPVIIYAIIANQNSSINYQVNIDQLFIVGLLPSFIVIAIFTIYSFFKEKPIQNSTQFSFSKSLNAIKAAKWEIPLPILVYGGIYSGFFTVLEASIVVTLYVFLVIFIFTKELSLKQNFLPITTAALKLSGGIFIIMAAAFVLTNFLVYMRIPDKIFNVISLYLHNKYTFLLAINIFLLIAGCVLDIFSAILIILPLIIPIAENYGINAYHFAIIFLVNLEIGYITPPVGINLFIASYRFKKTIIQLYRYVLPFLFMMIVSLLLITYIPTISTFSLPQDLSKNTNISNLKQIKNITLQQSSTSSLTFQLSISSQELKNIDHFVVYYLDEVMDDNSLFIDFAEQLIIEKTLENHQPNSQSFSITLPNLEPKTTYSIAIQTQNKEGKQSLISKTLQFSTK